MFQHTSIQPSPGSALLRRSFRRTFPPAVRGQGAYLWDSHGKQYLDFSGSVAVNFIGHGVQDIVAAMTHQARSLEFVDNGQFTTPIAEQYAKDLLGFAGPAFAGGSVCFTCSGTEALDVALKLAREYQAEIGNFSRTQTITRDLNDHRSAFGPLRNRRHRDFPRPASREFTTIRAPYSYRCPFCKEGACTDCAQAYALELEAAIAAANGKVAAVLIEPISGSAPGAAVPPPGYLEKVAQICAQNDILLIADETTTGVGRTGRNFAFDHFAVSPDILITANGLSSGYAPLGAVILSPKLVEAVAYSAGPVVQGFAYSSHPISLAAGSAVLNHIQRNQLVPSADSECEGTIASELAACLKKIDHEFVGDVRGLGFFWAVEFVAEKTSRRPFPVESNFSGLVAQSAIERGLLVYPMQGCADGTCGDLVLIAPPAVISRDQIDWACEALTASIHDAASQAAL